MQFIMLRGRYLLPKQHVVKLPDINVKCRIIKLYCMHKEKHNAMYSFIHCYNITIDRLQFATCL